MQLEKQKPLSASFDLKKCSTYNSMFKTESNIAIQNNEQQYSIGEKTYIEIKGFFATENLNAKTEQAQV